jgi:hypothetical protein
MTCRCYFCSAVIVDRRSVDSTGQVNPKLGEIVLSLAARCPSATRYHLYLAYPAAAGPPLGLLLPGPNSVRVSAVRKLTSRQGMPYFRAGVWTSFTLLSPDQDPGKATKKLEDEYSDDWLLGHHWDLLGTGNFTAAVGLYRCCYRYRYLLVLYGM